MKQLEILNAAKEYYKSAIDKFNSLSVNYTLDTYLDDLEYTDEVSSEFKALRYSIVKNRSIRKLAFDTLDGDTRFIDVYPDGTFDEHFLHSNNETLRQIASDDLMNLAISDCIFIYKNIKGFK